MNLTFRLATHADAAALASLINSAYRGESSTAGWTTEAHLLDGLRTNAETIASLIADPNKCFLLALDESGRLEGCVHLERRVDARCYLGMLTVVPTGQARGVGRALLVEAERHARDRYGAKSMEMTVITARHELLAWYERRGYARTGNVFPFPAHPLFGVPKVDALAMEVLDKPLL